MSQTAADSSGQQARLEQGNTALVQENGALIQLLVQDAAALGGHQVNFVFVSLQGLCMSPSK